jgi:predicted dehydrogenase
MKQIGIGIIGTGFTRRVQIPAFLECEGVRVVSVASATEANAKAAAAEFGIGHWTTDWKETVEHPEVDFVCMTTPPKTHREIALHTLSAKKHLLAEKPFAMSSEEAEEMVAAASKAGVFAIVDHELRFLPGRLKAFDMIRAGEIGTIRHAKYSFRAPHRGDPDAVWNWWSDREQGGGALGAIGSHAIDTLHWYLGAEVKSVFCQLQTHIKRRKDSSGETREVTSDDEANLTLRFHPAGFAEDATATISVSMTEYPEYQNRVELFGSTGALRIDSKGELFVGDVDAGEWRQVPVDIGENIPGNADTGFARAFRFIAPLIIEAIREGKTTLEHAATFEDGLRVQKVIDAAHRSNDSGRVEEL